MGLKADGSMSLVKIIHCIYVSAIAKSLWSYLLMTSRIKVHVVENKLLSLFLKSARSAP